MYTLGFVMSKTKEDLRAASVLGRRLTAPETRWRVPRPSKSSLALGHLLLMADKCIHSTAGPPWWSQENTVHLAEKSVRLANGQASGKRKNKNETPEGSWASLHCRRQNCRDLRAQSPLSAQTQ